MRSIEVHRDGDWQTVYYELRRDGWYVRGEWQDELTRFAAEEARSVDVRQLIRKQHSDRY